MEMDANWHSTRFVQHPTITRKGVLRMWGRISLRADISPVDWALTWAMAYWALSLQINGTMFDSNPFFHSLAVLASEGYWSIVMDAAVICFLLGAVTRNFTMRLCGLTLYLMIWLTLGSAFWHATPWFPGTGLYTMLAGLTLHRGYELWRQPKTSSPRSGRISGESPGR